MPKASTQTANQTGDALPMTTAVIVGSGPNGLAAAIHLASRGVRVTVLEAKQVVGGGARSSRGSVDGLIHDECAGFHPLGVNTAFAREHRLDRYGLRWLNPKIDLVHPLDDGTAGVLHQRVDLTADGLGCDAKLWRTLFGRTSASFDRLADDVLAPVISVPRHPIAMARFGVPTLLPAALLGRLFRNPAARALFVGTAAHAFQPLSHVLSSAIGLGILTAGHHNGWVVAAGGTQSITDAMVARLDELGGRIETGVQIFSAHQLPPTDITMFDLAPPAVAAILGDQLPTKVAKQFRRFRFGPAAFKVDFAVESGVPWTNPDAHQAGTLHLGGHADEVIATERAIQHGRMPEQPFVLVGQQYLADPSRSAGGIHPLYTYAHVPAGYTGDATGAIVKQIERFAPGFSDRIVNMTGRSPSQMSAYNANYVGGDILTGSKDLRQLVFGPRLGRSPYTVGLPGIYICSAATPPGPGVHGMCGYNAAKLALADAGLDVGVH